MCELMGMSFAQPISADFTIREFALRNEGNVDGWGLGWYPDKSLALVKEPLSSGESHHMRFLETYQRLQSRLYIAHVRHGTRGGVPTHADTHPFRRELNGREYCFAHNGTIVFSPDQLPLKRFLPIGHTDSEHVFCYLLEAIAGRNRPLEDDSAWQWLYGLVSQINRMGSLNFLMSDGERLFVYRDLGGWKGLHLRKVRFHRDRVRHLEDPGIGVELETIWAGDTETDLVNTGFIIATKPLSSQGWHSLKLGELIVIHAGSLSFSSHRKGPRLQNKTQ